jgi:hypothetical protein
LGRATRAAAEAERDRRAGPTVCGSRSQAAAPSLTTKAGQCAARAQNPRGPQRQPPRALRGSAVDDEAAWPRFGAARVGVALARAALRAGPHLHCSPQSRDGRRSMHSIVDKCTRTVGRAGCEPLFSTRSGSGYAAAVMLVQVVKTQSHVFIKFSTQSRESLILKPRAAAIMLPASLICCSHSQDRKNRWQLPRQKRKILVVQMGTFVDRRNAGLPE